MAKCLLDHCEFAWNGQCCLVCPKGLNERIERNDAADRIDAFVKMLKLIKNGVKGNKEGGLPVGVCLDDGVYYAYVNYNKKQVILGKTTDIEIALKMREDAIKAKKNGVFEEWLKQHRAKLREANKAKRMRKKKVL